jgi:hypothetical protein
MQTPESNFFAMVQKQTYVLILIVVIIALLICIWMANGLRTASAGPVPSDAAAALAAAVAPSAGNVVVQPGQINDASSGAVPSDAAASLAAVAAGTGTAGVAATSAPIKQAQEVPQMTGDIILDSQADAQADIDNHNSISVADEEAEPGFNIENNGSWFEGNAVTNAFLNLLKQPTSQAAQDGTAPDPAAASQSPIASFIGFVSRKFSSRTPKRFVPRTLTPSFATQKFGGVTLLDAVVGEDGVVKVLIATKKLQPGDMINLYGIVALPTLMAGAASSIDMCSIGGQVFSRESTGWRFRGPIGYVWVAGPTNVSPRWDLYPSRETGWMVKATLDSCPFPQSICGTIWTWAATGQTGRLTMADGTQYSFDGRFVTQI